MKFIVKSGDLIKQKGCLMVGVYENGELTPAATKLDKLSQGYIKKILKQDAFKGKAGESLLLYHVPNISSEQILLVGCGKNQALSVGEFRKITKSSIKGLSAAKTEAAVFFLTELNVEDHDAAWIIKQTATLTADILYTFFEYKTEKQPTSTLKELTFYLENKNEQNACTEALNQAMAINAGTTFTKNLANAPSNICTPTYVANQASTLAKQYKSISVKIIEQKEMQKLGMGAFLSVAKGSAQPPKLVCIEYNKTVKKAKTIALVGKGITFDTGGISLKPADGMVGMKYDMCGAATVVGVMKAAAELKLPIRIVGLLALAENMPSSTASKPEDIVTSMSGKTIEILNTDAEGRLVLCDTLTYAERFKPDAVIDIATLTGAVVIALGHHATGLISNNEKLADQLLAAGTKIHDRAWQLPLWDEYQDQLKSPFADMSNVGGRAAGTITAACFLSRFAKKYPWAHLDVAGTAAMMMGGNDRYATGRPVPLLTQYLIDQSK